MSRVLSLSDKLTADREASKDMVQELFISLWNKHEKTEFELQFSEKTVKNLKTRAIRQLRLKLGLLLLLVFLLARR